MPKRRILIVDNNDELRAILEAALGSLGHEAVVTGDRAEALDRKDLAEFDLIISDLTGESDSEVHSNSDTERPTPPSANVSSSEYRRAGHRQSLQSGRSQLPPASLQSRRAARDS